ncbi:MAG: glycoside hydrolase family 2 protein [Acidobacteriota bacterium]
MKKSLWMVVALSLLGSRPMMGRGSGDFPEIPPFVLPVALTDWDPGEDPMASRLFRTTTTRTQISLGGFWDFATDPLDKGEKLSYATNFPEPETRLWIPGTWNSYARYWHYEGAAWLRRSFDVPVDGEVRIRFGGVFYKCKVWLDGDYLGGHEGGYSPFAVVKKVTCGRHSLVVLADNRLDNETLPKAGVDWFPYGGIHRPVYAEVVPGVCIDNFHAITTSLESEKARLTVRAYLRSSLIQRAEANLVFEVNGHTVGSRDCEIKPGQSEVELEIVLDKPVLWSPSRPYLYCGRLVLSVAPAPRVQRSSGSERGQPHERGGLLDDQLTRFGLRKFELAGPQILLNGRPFKLMGANHHDDHPDWGSALPPNVIRHDVEILKRMGANAARGHYPPDEIFMDYCDQAGLVFMNEIPAWQYDYSQLSSPVIQKKMREQFAEMVLRDMNHPCVFSWSLGNEWREFGKCYEVVKGLTDYARRLDSTRFITYVTGGAGFGPGSALLDIISTNWAQYQWYDPFTILDDHEGQKSIALLEELHARFPDKPVILTEFGAAEAQAGWHNWGNVKWSEEYQARSVADSARFGLEKPWTAGGCVWQFCETRSAPSRFLAGRLRGWNGKGIVDGYRSPKMAFYKLQEIFHSHSPQPDSQDTHVSAVRGN